MGVVREESEVARLIGELNVHSALGQAQTNEIICLKAEVETLSGCLDEAGKALSAAKDGHDGSSRAENAEQALSVKEAEAASFRRVERAHDPSRGAGE